MSEQCLLLLTFNVDRILLITSTNAVNLLRIFTLIMRTAILLYHVLLSLLMNKNVSQMLKCLIKRNYASKIDSFN